jgi:hypothetical protein
MKSILCVLLLSAVQLSAADPAILKTEFIYDTGPYPQIHATTITETPTGLVSRLVRRHGGKKPGCVHLGVASRRWQVDREASKQPTACSRTARVIRHGTPCCFSRVKHR